MPLIDIRIGDPSTRSDYRQVTRYLDDITDRVDKLTARMNRLNQDLSSSMRNFNRKIALQWDFYDRNLKTRVDELSRKLKYSGAIVRVPWTFDLTPRNMDFQMRQLGKAMGLSTTSGASRYSDAAASMGPGWFAAPPDDDLDKVFPPGENVRWKDGRWQKVDGQTAILMDFMKGMEKDIGAVRKTAADARADFDRLNNSINKVGRSTGDLMQGVTKFAIIMSGIAATIFVFQQVKQWVQALVQLSYPLERNLARIEAFNRNGPDSPLREQFINRSRGQGFKAEDVSAAYLELLSQGASAARADELAVDVTRMAATGLVDLSEAADIARGNIDELKNGLLRIYEAGEKTSEGPAKELSSSFNRLGLALQKASEPAVLDFINSLIRLVDKMAESAGKIDMKDQESGIYWAKEFAWLLQDKVGRAFKFTANLLSETYDELVKPFQVAGTIYGNIESRLSSQNRGPRIFTGKIPNSISPLEPETPQSQEAIFRLLTIAAERKSGTRGGALFNTFGVMSPMYAEFIRQQESDQFKKDAILYGDAGLAGSMRKYGQLQREVQRAGLFSSTYDQLTSITGRTDYGSAARTAGKNLKEFLWDLMGLGDEERKLLRSRTRADIVSLRTQPVIRAGEDLFGVTGQVSDSYRAAVLKNRRAQLNVDVRAGLMTGDDRDAVLGATGRDLDRQEIEKRLEPWENYFEKTKILTEEHYGLRKRLIEVDLANVRDANLRKLLEERKLFDLNQELLESRTRVHTEYYEATGKMSDTYYEKQLKAIERERDDYIKAQNDKQMADELFYRAKLRLDAQKAASDGNILEAFNKGVEIANQETKTWGETALDVGMKINTTFANTATDGLLDWVNGVKSAKQAFDDFAVSTLNWMLKIIAQQEIMNMLGGGGAGKGSLVMKGIGFLGGLVGLGSGGGGIGGGLTTGITATGGAMGLTYAAGGWVNEPVIGFGTRSGRRYTFAEHAPEKVSQAGTAGSGGGNGVTIVNIPDPRLGAEFINSSEGRNAIINVIHQNAGIIKQMLR